MVGIWYLYIDSQLHGHHCNSSTNYLANNRADYFYAPRGYNVIVWNSNWQLCWSWPRWLRFNLLLDVPKDGASSCFSLGFYFSGRQKPHLPPVHKSTGYCRPNEFCLASAHGLRDFRHHSRHLELGHSRHWPATPWVSHNLNCLLALRHSDLAALRFCI